MASKPNGAALPGMETPSTRRGGPVYTGVRVQIRHALGGDDELAEARAGLAAQARSLAHTIDCASGYAGHKVETYALPQLHRELRELLAAIAGGAELGDAEALAALLEGDGTPESAA